MHQAPAPDAHATHGEPNDPRLYRKIAWRLIPFLCFCYLAAYLDRINVGFAKLQMAEQLQLSEAAFGLGAGLFFVGYILYDTSLMLHYMGTDDYVLAAVSLYLDLINLFIYLMDVLRMLQGGDN